jgi:hypothetical protein
MPIRFQINPCEGFFGLRFGNRLLGVARIEGWTICLGKAQRGSTHIAIY